MKFRPVILLLLFTIGFNGPLLSQVYQADEYSESISLQFDNDTYYQTDYYYTYGLKVGVNLPFFGNAPWNSIFIKPQNPSTISGMSIAQKLYTPKNIRDTLVQFNDRPFAATLELAQISICADSLSGFIIKSTIRLGILGPAAGGELLQKKIHEWIDSPDPEGWKYQLQNDLILNYDIGVSKPFVANDNIRLSGDGTLRIGTLNDDLEAGLNIALKSNKKNKSGVWFQLYGGGRYVIYNGSLQGGLFTNDNYGISQKQITPLVFLSNAEIGVWLNSINLSYSHFYLSKEFDNGIDHNYGSFRLVVQL